MQLDVQSYDVHRYIDAAWIAVALVWFAGAFTTKRTLRAQPARSRLAYVTLALLGCLLFTKNFRFGPFAWRFVPMSAGAAYTGLFLTIAGIAFTIWARFYLGNNWSGRPTIKQDHALVRRGPYALVRHPIYTGVAVAMFGTAIAIGEIRGLVGTVLVLIGLKIKSLTEEMLMTEQFGADYLSYKQQVKGLIPFVW